jgi:hypothetical protein
MKGSSYNQTNNEAIDRYEIKNQSMWGIEATNTMQVIFRVTIVAGAIIHVSL